MLMSVREAADFLRVSMKTIYRLIAAGKIPHARVGDQYRFSREELIAWARACGRRVHPESLKILEEKRERLSTLAQAIERGGICYRVGGSTRHEVLKEIVALMKMPLGIGREYMLKRLLAREILASTGIGGGIAIPHLRYPLPEVRRPMVTLALLENPVDWEAVDGKPVRVVFVPCCPTVRSHLHILRRIAFASRDAAWVAMLQAGAKHSEILEVLRSLERRLKPTRGTMGEA
jgi:PTS system nitrogen regulatory IIA component